MAWNKKKVFLIFKFPIMNILEKIALTKIKGIGPKLSRILLAYNGSIEEIFRCSKKQLLTIPGINENIANTIVSKNFIKQAEEEYSFILKHAIQILWIEDENYPMRLKNCEDSPILLYFKGNANLNPSRAVSIVGTRNLTSYGRRICENFIPKLKEYGIQIISGLAYGVDYLAHLEALNHQIVTLGVLGHGLDRIYPPQHRDLASRMIHNGGLLTEFPSGRIPEPPNFPMRNRIIAGLADVTIVIESSMEGKALITAKIANSYNRDVCAFPGDIYREYSAGCNYLIKANLAHLIRGPEDLSYIMNWEKVETPIPTNKIPPNNLIETEENKMLN